jgi:hypothetical protein
VLTDRRVECFFVLVLAEMSLHVIAHNLKRVMKVLGVVLLVKVMPA